VDGAFGAAAILSKTMGHRLKGLARVDSLAFDFHKWWQVNYEAGCVLIRDPYLHRQSYSNRPEYLRHDEDGLAGGDFWAVDYGPELSRSFRALKVWTHLKTHGIDAIAEVVERNISQAQYLKARIEAEPKLELLAPVALNIVCFRYDFRYEGTSHFLACQKWRNPCLVISPKGNVSIVATIRHGYRQRFALCRYDDN